MTGKNNELSVRGFLGEYEVIVRYNGKPIMLQKFTNSKGTVKVNIDVPAGNRKYTSVTEFEHHNRK